MVLPVFWMMVVPAVPAATLASLLAAINTLFALEVLIIAVPALSLAGALLFSLYGLK